MLGDFSSVFKSVIFPRSAIFRRAFTRVRRLQMLRITILYQQTFVHFKMYENKINPPSDIGCGDETEHVICYYYFNVFFFVLVLGERLVYDR